MGQVRWSAGSRRQMYHTLQASLYNFISSLTLYVA
jgi:hypothetical protein